VNVVSEWDEFHDWRVGALACWRISGAAVDFGFSWDLESDQKNLTNDWEKKKALYGGIKPVDRCV
jgi:hypothetical protein